ncbi:MAG: LuxR C-terminal-related transcriptional regulator, partial [Acidimicrobiales bacterium]
IAHIRLALDLLDPTVEPVTAGLLHERLGRFLWTADQDGLPDHVRALELVPAEPPSAERARVLAGYAQILMLNGSLAQSAEVAADAVEIARTVGAIQAEGHALNTLGTVLIPQGRVDEGMECLERSRQIAHDIGNLDDMARACVNLTHSLSVLGRWDELIVEGEAGVEWARRVGQDRTCGVYVESNLLDALVARGRWDEAAERSASLPTRLPIGYWEYFTGGSVLADRGDFVRAREIAERLVDVPDDGTAMLQGLTDHVVGAMALAIWTGEPEQARHLMELGLASIPDPFLIWRGGELFWRALWAEADLAARARGARDVEAERTARAAAAAWFERAQRVASGPLDGVLPSPSLLVHLTLCEAERARVDEQDHPDDWQRAIDAVDRFGLRFQGAYGRFRLVESLLRTGGDRARAAAELEAARDAAAALGAGPLASEIDALARRSRLLVAGPDDVDPDEGDDDAAAAFGLSPRELQVLRLVAEGATNRQVAEQLFISPKTASVHVSNILAKLGVASRGEAAAVAHRLGVTTES